VSITHFFHFLDVAFYPGFTGGFTARDVLYSLVSCMVSRSINCCLVCLTEDYGNGDRRLEKTLFLHYRLLSEVIQVKVYQHRHCLRSADQTVDATRTRKDKKLIRI